MGNWRSKREEEDQEKSSDCLEKWRDDGLGRWNEAAVLKLRREIMECLRDLGKRRNINFLVCGGIGVGKSSFVNNCMTSLSGEIYQSYTYENDEVKTLPLQFCDTMGMNVREGIASVAACILGKVKIKEEMNTRSDREWEERLPARNKVSFIFFVVPAAYECLMDEFENHFRDLRTLAIKEEIPVAVILTRCDRLDGRVKLNVSNLHYSVKVMESVKYVSSFFNIQENRVFPVKNYIEELNASSEMMIQTLLALNLCLRDIRSQELAKVETSSDS